MIPVGLMTYTRTYGNLHLYFCLIIHKMIERFGGNRIMTEQYTLPKLTIDIRVGIRLEDRGQPDTLVPLAVV